MDYRTKRGLLTVLISIIVQALTANVSPAHFSDNVFSSVTSSNKSMDSSSLNTSLEFTPKHCKYLFSCTQRILFKCLLYAIIRYCTAILWPSKCSKFIKIFTNTSVHRYI